MRAGFIDFIPAMIATVVWGFVTGVAMVKSGLSGFEATLMTLFVYAGSAQLTALPLIGFSYAVRRVPYSVIGFMQYIAPTLQLMIGVLVLGEVFDRTRAIGFGFIWVGLLIFATDGAWRARRKPAALPVVGGLE